MVAADLSGSSPAGHGRVNGYHHGFVFGFAAGRCCLDVFGAPVLKAAPFQKGGCGVRHKDRIATTSKSRSLSLKAYFFMPKL
jgi:hypothetical protein